MSAWYVYLIRAAHGVLYTGITTDVARRLEQHRAGRGAKFLRGRGPLAVVYERRVGSQSLALGVECRVKRMTRAEKETLVRAAPSRQRLLRILGTAER